MKCFNHEGVDAVAICKNCNKALCHACASDVGNGVACTGACEDEVRALNEGATGPPLNGLVTRITGTRSSAPFWL